MNDPLALKQVRLLREKLQNDTRSMSDKELLKYVEKKANTLRQESKRTKKYKDINSLLSSIHKKKKVS